MTEISVSSTTIINMNILLFPPSIVLCIIVDFKNYLRVSLFWNMMPLLVAEKVSPQHTAVGA